MSERACFAEAKWPNRLVVIGAGAMGSVFGAAFAKAGFDAVLIDRRSDHVAAINASGLTVAGVPGERHVHVEATEDATGVSAADLALIFVGSDNTKAAARLARSVLTPGGYALTLQNGVGNIEAIAEILGAERVIAGSTYSSAAYLGPARVLHSNVGETVIGVLDATAAGACGRLAEVLTEVGFPTVQVENVHGHIWLKFVLNCAINPVCAATGLRPGEVMRTRSARALLESVLDEIMMVVEAKGISLATPDPRGYVLEHGWTRYNRPSMLQHVVAGMRPEIDALNGALVREARALGVSVPINFALSRIVIAIAERHRLRLTTPDLNEAELEAAAKSEPDPFKR